MASRTTVGIAAVFVASAFAGATAIAQESGAPGHSARAGAHATQHAGQAASVSGDVKSQASYSLGLLLGSRLPQLGLQDSDFPQVEQGLKEVVSGKVHPTETDQQNVQGLIKRSQSGAGEKNAAAPHSLGVLLGARLPQLGLEGDAVDFDKVSQGLKDVMSAKVHPSAADEQKVEELLKQSRSAAADRNEAAAHRFLAANGKRAGVKTTKSGLQYKVLNPGNGKPPQSKDKVTVNYRGTLLDGTVFDSSYARGQPFTFVLDQDRVIPGWEEALPMMKPGSKWQLFIPPDLAYGKDSSPPIPPNSLLKFDVELLSVAAPSPASAPGASAPGAAPKATPQP